VDVRVVYEIDSITEPAADRRPLEFTEVYLGQVTVDDFRRNPRGGELGTRTATLHADGLQSFRQNWVYLVGLAGSRQGRPR